MIYGQIWGQISNIELNSEDETIGSYEYFYNNPLDLNNCSKEELSQIQFLSPIQINSFIVYREQQIQLLHIYELQVIPNWDLSTCRKITQLVVVQSNKEQKFGLKNTFILLRLEETLEKAQGFNSSGKSSAYQGDRIKEFLKIKNSSNSAIKFSLIAQKDAGETSPFDFFSTYLDITPKKYVQKIIIGDFSVQWGQGLLQAGGFNLGKNYESIKSTQKFHLGGIPYSSSAEYSFNRGIFINKVIHQQINYQFFVSNKLLDGKLYNTNELLGFKTIDTDGYHRNISEIANQHTIREFKLGNSIQVNISKNANIQINSVFTKYDKPKISSGIDYKKNEWTGNQFAMWSMSHASTISNKRIINEIAIQANKSISLIHGAAISNSKKQDFSYLFRYFSSGFYNPDGKALGENSKNENEIGLFLGHQFQLSKRQKLSSYIDLFYFPEIKYQVSYPNTYGWELLNRYQMERKNTYKFFNQIKWTSKQEDQMSSKNEKIIQRTHDLQESIDISFIGKKWMQWHSRLMLHYLSTNEVSYLGAMLLQDIEMNYRKFQIKGRIAYINTPNYDTRLYAFEAGLPYSFNLLAYSGQAIRMAATIEIPIIKDVTLSTKIGRILYFDKNEIGSSTDLIQANHKTDLSLQIVYKNL